MISRKGSPMTAPDRDLLERVVRAIRRPGGSAPTNVKGSILAQAASSYGARPVVDEATVPTGFDPAAAELFEATVETAFLVANANGIFSDDERIAFRTVIAEACNNQVQHTQLDALIADLIEQLNADGMEKRARMVSRTISRRDHQNEVLRIATLMAHIAGGVGEAQRKVLEALVRCFDLDSGAVDSALREAERALSSG